MVVGSNPVDGSILSWYLQSHVAPSFPESLELPNKLQVGLSLVLDVWPNEAWSSPNTKDPSGFGFVWLRALKMGLVCLPPQSPSLLIIYKPNQINLSATR